MVQNLLLLPVLIFIVSCALIDIPADRDKTQLNPEEIYASDRLSYRYKNEILNKDTHKTTTKNTLTHRKFTQKKEDELELFEAWKQQKKLKSKNYQSFKEWQEFQDWRDYQQSKEVAK